MSKLKQLFTNWKILLLIAALFISVVLINPNFDNEGVAIRSVSPNSSADIAGMHKPASKDKPMFREVIIEVDGKKISDIEDYNDAIADIKAEETIIIKTLSKYTYDSEGGRSFNFIRQPMTYKLEVNPLYEIIELNETVQITEERIVQENVTVNGTTTLVNKTKSVIKYVPKTEKNVIGVEDLGLDVYNAPKTNIKKGLDLEGGTRVLLEPESEVDSGDLEIIIANLEKRLNVYGLTDLQINAVDRGLFDEKKLILIEIAGANEKEVLELISNQGKFEAKIAGETVFVGGKDIKSVCRDSTCSFAVDPTRPCGRSGDGYVCSFMFAISLSQEAAEKQAEVTKELDVVSENGNDYLSEPLQLYLDDELMDELNIGASLRGVATTDIQISGSGFGDSLLAARDSSAANMKQLQTILITGSLPVKLNVVKVDTVSATLGSQFLNNAILVGFAAIIAVAAVVFARYRKIMIALPMFITMIAEVVMILGFAALAGWNLDLAAMAGIIIAVGTGVDDQIVIVDEARRKKGSLSWKQRIKRAFFVIFAAFFTTLVAMLPLLAAGAGLLKGFALTTIFGIFVGVMIARPAFAIMLEIIMKD